MTIPLLINLTVTWWGQEQKVTSGTKTQLKKLQLVKGWNQSHVDPLTGMTSFFRHVEAIGVWSTNCELFPKIHPRCAENFVWSINSIEFRSIVSGNLFNVPVNCWPWILWFSFKVHLSHDFSALMLFSKSQHVLGGGVMGSYWNFNRNMNWKRRRRNIRSYRFV